MLAQTQYPNCSETSCSRSSLKLCEESEQTHSRIKTSLDESTGRLCDPAACSLLQVGHHVLQGAVAIRREFL